MAKAVAYLRVYTIDKDLEKNKEDILRLANQLDLGKVHFVEEKVSGKVPWRQRKIAGILEDFHKGDVVLLSELSRLGRFMLECMEIISIAVNKGIRMYTVKGGWHLDDSIQSKIMAMVFAMAAEIERDLISKRTKESLKAKKDAGIKLGRPEGPGKSKLDQYQPEIRALLQNGASKKFIANRYRTSESNLFNWLAKNGQNIIKKSTLVKTIILSFSFLIQNIISAQDTSAAIDERFLNSVIRLEIPQRDSLGRPLFSPSGQRITSRGTAMLLTNGKNKSSGYGKVILITNKHMIGEYLPDGSFSLFDTLHADFYTRDRTKAVGVGLDLRDPKMGWERLIKLHPNPDVDVAAINISGLYTLRKVNEEIIDTSWLMSFDKLQACGCVGLGSQVFAIGYPRGIRLGTTSLPLAKSGYIASPIPQPIEIERYYLAPDGQTLYYPIKGNILLVDGLITHGNSGSPLVLPKGVTTQFEGGKLTQRYLGRNSIIGIVSAGFDDAGLAIIFSSDYILDLMRQY